MGQESSVRPDAERHPTWTDPSDGAMRVLLIEDSDADAMLVREYLAEAKEVRFETERAVTLTQARDLLHTRSFDVTLVDMILPDSRGRETIDALSTWSIPVVVLSGMDDRNLALEAVRSGAHDYLLKDDVSPAMLSRVLQYAVERHRTEREVAERERRWRAMIHNSSDVIALIDRELRTTYVSASIERLSGIDPQRMSEEPVTAFIHEDDRDRVTEALERIAQGAESDPVVFRFAAGHTGWRWFEAVATNLLDDPAVRAIVVNARDVTEPHEARRNLERVTRDLQQRVSHLDTLQKIGDAIISSTSLDHSLSVVLDQVRRELDVDAADILLLDPVDHTLRYAAGKGFRANIVGTTQIRVGEAMAGRVALERVPVFIEDVSEMADAFRPQGLIGVEGFRSYACLPLVARGELQGTLGIFHRDSMPIPEPWRELATSVARQAAIAIDNAQMFEGLQRSHLELQLSYDQTIEGWARALDLRDEETAGHSKRVTLLSVDLAERLGMHGGDLANVRRGALLHDIGKMGVPDSILLKPGPLTDQEREIMQRHTTHARDLLAGTPFLERALAIPYSHHERWDGGGYPEGLQGERIPLAARIFAVVDVFDALTSDRPYRNAWSREKALSYIRDESGTHFDPKVVDAFLEMIEGDGGG